MCIYISFLFLTVDPCFEESNFFPFCSIPAKEKMTWTKVRVVKQLAQKLPILVIWCKIKMNHALWYFIQLLIHYRLLSQRDARSMHALSSAANVWERGILRLKEWSNAGSRLRNYSGGASYRDLGSVSITQMNKGNVNQEALAWFSGLFLKLTRPVLACI